MIWLLQDFKNQISRITYLLLQSYMINDQLNLNHVCTLPLGRTKTSENMTIQTVKLIEELRTK